VYGFSDGDDVILGDWDREKISGDDGSDICIAGGGGDNLRSIDCEPFLTRKLR